VPAGALVDEQRGEQGPTTARVTNVAMMAARDAAEGSWRIIVIRTEIRVRSAARRHDAFITRAFAPCRLKGGRRLDPDNFPRPWSVRDCGMLSALYTE